MARPTLFIDGEAGTTGLEIRARLAGRDDLELVSIAADRRKEPEERRRLINSVDLAVLCLPDAAAREAVALIENPRVRVLDASTAHRVSPGWEYGFPELVRGHRERLRAAARVANPGCYAIGMVALVRPLTEAGILPRDHALYVHAVEGYSGGGRQMIEAFETAGEGRDADPYRLYGLELRHKHVPEMQLYGGLATRPMFVPAVGAWRQGMLVQIPLFLDRLPGRATGRPTGRDVQGALAAHYAGERFVTVLPYEDRPSRLTPEGLNGTNRMELHVLDNAETGQVLLVAHADNLGKGASGQAAQNIDVMLGLEGAQDYQVRPC